MRGSFKPHMDEYHRQGEHLSYMSFVLYSEACE